MTRDERARIVSRMDDTTKTPTIVVTDRAQGADCLMCRNEVDHTHDIGNLQLAREELGEMFFPVIQRCARCGEDHKDVRAVRLARPMAPGDLTGKVWSHWWSCPTTGEPVMVGVYDEAFVKATRERVTQVLRYFAEHEDELDGDVDGDELGQKIVEMIIAAVRG